MNPINDHSASCNEEHIQDKFSKSKVFKESSEQRSHSMPPFAESSISHNHGSAGSDDIEAFIQ